MSDSTARWLASPQARVDIDRERCERSLHHFTKSGWRYIDPAPFVDNWHLGAMAEHLEAVVAGEIRRLLICIPPRHMKSLMSCVSLPAFTWALDPAKAGRFQGKPLAGPGVKFLTLSYGMTLSTRDALKTRWLLESPWYQERWGDRWSFRADQNEKDRYVNDHGGHRIPSAVNGLGTGEGGDVIVVDDAHNVLDAESDVKRQAAVTWFREVLPTRFNDQRTGAMIVVMQRTHEADVPGWIIENDPDYEKLVLPARFEADHPQVWKRDPRVEGQLLWAEKVPERELSRLERTLGEYAAAGQLQQRPSPRQGGLFKVDRIKIITSLPRVSRWCRAWDLAGTEGAGAFTAGVLIGKREDGAGYVIADVKRRQFSPGKVQRFIKTTAEIDRTGRLAGAINEATGEVVADAEAPVLFNGSLVKVRLPQDPGQAGKSQKTDFIKLLDGFAVKIDTVTGDKETRATPFAVQVEGERVFMLEAEWNDAYLNELRLFPGGKNADQVDASSDAYNDVMAGGTPSLHAPQTVKLAPPSFG